MYTRLNYSYISCYVLFPQCPCLSCSNWQLCVFDRWMIICAVALNTGPADPINLKSNLHLWPLTRTWPRPETSPTPHSGIFLYLFIYAYIIRVALKWPWLQEESYVCSVTVYSMVQHEFEQICLWSLPKAFCQHTQFFISLIVSYIILIIYKIAFIRQPITKKTGG